jgi:hypothetical protein
MKKITFLLLFTAAVSFAEIPQVEVRCGEGCVRAAVRSKVCHAKCNCA